MNVIEQIRKSISNRIFFATVDKDEMASILKRLALVKNESGQVKINYTGLTLSDFTANTIKTFDINSATPIVVSSPTTMYPKSTTNSYMGVFDSTQGIAPIGRLKENPINGQQHLWRIQGNYSGKANGNNGELQIILTNPISGFLYVFTITLPTGRTTGVFNALCMTIADGQSIPNGTGYILKSETSFTDSNLSVDITSITRTSISFENIVE